MYPGQGNYQSNRSSYSHSSHSPPAMQFPGTEPPNNEQEYSNSYGSQNYNENHNQGGGYQGGGYQGGGYQGGGYQGSGYERREFPDQESGTRGIDGDGYQNRGYPGEDYSKNKKHGKSRKDDGYPGNSYQDQGGYPQNSYQGGGYPQNEYQGGGYPQNSYQGGGYPQNDYQGGGYPQNDYQGSGYPQSDYQSGSYNDEYQGGHRSNMPQEPGKYNNGQSNFDQSYNQGGYNQPPSHNDGFYPPPPLGSTSYTYYNTPPVNNDAVAPPANMSFPAVDYSQIHYGGMDFPEFHSAPAVHQGSNYHQPPVGNVPNYSNIPQEVQQQFSNVQLSNCEGRKRALLIGINYTGTKFRLRGCINDVHRMKKFLIDHFQFKESDMVLLTDDQKNPNRLPTRANILKAMKWLVHDAAPNDSFFFHYSGHGSRVEDLDGDEVDGEDETICPLDFEENGQIIDDDMNAIMVRPLPQGARLTAIFDCCHSGTILDLPFNYSSQGKLKHNTALDLAGSSLKGVGQSYLKGDVQGALAGLMSSVKIFTTADDKLKQQRENKSSAGDVIMFSGCKDTQTSADAKEDLNFTGAMSWAFTNSLYENPQQTYIQLLNNIRDRLKDKYTQLPQLSSGRLMDMDTVFIM